MAKPETSKPLVEQLTFPENEALAKIKLGALQTNVLAEIKDVALSTRFNKSPSSVAGYVREAETRIIRLLIDAERQSNLDVETVEQLNLKLSELLFAIKTRVLEALAEERKKEGLTVDDQVLLNRHLVGFQEIAKLDKIEEKVRGEVKRSIAKLLAILEWNKSPFSIGQFAKITWNEIRAAYKEVDGSEEEKMRVYSLLQAVKDRCLKVLREKRNDHGIKLRDEEGHTVVNPVRMDLRK